MIRPQFVASKGSKYRLAHVRQDWARDWPGERCPGDKTIKGAHRELKETGSSKYSKCVPEIIVCKVWTHLWFYLRLKGPTPYVLTPQKLAEVKALCDAEDAKPEHEKRANGYNNPTGLKQPTWRRHALIFSCWRIVF